MRRWRLCLLWAAVLLPACAHAPRADATDLRVMTYNIYAGNDLTRQSNLTRVAALIDSLEVDVVFLQEVDRNTTRSGRVDQPAVLAQHTGLHIVFGRSMHYGGGEFGNAILSRWPVHSVRIVPLQDSLPADTAAQATEPRTLLHVVVRAPAGDIHLLGTHLDHRADPTARNAQLLRLLAYVADSVPRSAHVVFGGDFNARPDVAAVRTLGLVFQDAWTTCGAGDGHTFRSDRPDRRIDYIMLAGAQCRRAWVPNTELSDHRPVVVDLRLRR